MVSVGPIDRYITSQLYIILLPIILPVNIETEKFLMPDIITIHSSDIVAQKKVLSHSNLSLL